MKNAKIYYADPDPLFDELLRKVPSDIKRHQALLFSIGCRIDEILKRKGWSKTDFAMAMGKKNAEISKWMSGQHNFTIATIAKIEAVLGEDIISVKKYRKPVTGYTQTSKEKRRYLSDTQSKYGKKQ